MKFIQRIVSLIVVCLLVASISFADHSVAYIQASDAYNQGDYSKAYQLWLAEAQNGSTDAQVMLGGMSAAGKGTLQDFESAAKWFRMAAEAGNVNAQYRLGEMYFKGQGVSQNTEQAYAWFLVAAVNGNRAAKEKRRILQQGMTPEQHNQAQQLVMAILLKLAD